MRQYLMFTHIKIFFSKNYIPREQKKGYLVEISNYSKWKVYAFCFDEPFNGWKSSEEIHTIQPVAYI